MNAIAREVDTIRPIVHRTAGRSHGALTRLASPGDLGELLKPFVFVDLFDTAAGAAPRFGLHPHSGIATLTYIAEGSVTYEDTNGASGVLSAGGIEWMQAGRGVWHSGGIGEQGRVQGFQLWVALPPHLELGPSVSIYQGAADLQTAGPARVLLGSHNGATSPIESPSDINYLAVRLQAGERWRYVPPAAHDVLWVALGKGTVSAPDDISHGELAIFAGGHQPVEFLAETDAEFMLGSAARHPHDLVLGMYSVHTNADALAAGEARIREIHSNLVQAGRL